MPTLPLYLPSPPHPNASHRVTAPGGYEWWHFDAEDAATDTQIVVSLFDGFISDPTYLRQYTAYRRRPTRHAPPVPAAFPRARAAVCRAGRLLARCGSVPPTPGVSLVASSERVDVQLGPQRIWQGEDGRYHIEFEGDDDTAVGTRVGLKLVFTPALRVPPHELVCLSRAMTGADHRWIIAAPLCAVSGTISVTSVGQAERVTEFTGAGYHDHRFGSGPLGVGLRRWGRGRVLLEGTAMTFHAAEPRDRSQPVETHLVVADATGMTEQPTSAEWQVHGERDVPGADGLSLPERIDIGRELTLSQPRVLDAMPHRVRVTYTADRRGQRGTALCEIATPAHGLT